MGFKLNVHNGASWGNILKDLYVELDNTNWSSDTLAGFLDEVKIALDGKETRNIIKTLIDYTASPFDIVLVDTTNAVSITLPPTPTRGDRVEIIDVTGEADEHNITLIRNGELLQTIDEDLIMDIGFSQVTLIYDNTTNGWHVDIGGSHLGGSISSVNDPYLTLSAELTGAPTLNGGVIINRGSESDVLIQWNELTEIWELTTDGTNFSEILTADTVGGLTDHGTLQGLLDDDHTQYVHNTIDREITANHTFNSATSGAPFTVGSNSTKQMVSGLNANYVNGVLVSSQSVQPGDMNIGDMWVQEV